VTRGSSSGPAFHLRRLLGVAAALAALLASCAPAPPPAPPPRLTLAAARFAELPGWDADRQGEALPAFLRSCAVFARLAETQPIGPDEIAGTAADWRAPCEAAARTPPDEARRFFEAAFAPFRAANNDDPQGLFTGYYEPEIEGVRAPGGRFTAPLLRRPADLVAVDLGEFRPAWRGERTAGRVENGRLRPYATRAEIEAGALAGRGLELLWADPVDLFFLQIQGSGRVALPDGSLVRVGYDGQNGRPYVPVGRLLAERGVLPREEVTMQAIRGWMAAHPAEAAALMRENPSYVFFRELAGDGPVGTLGAALTPGRSLAVDRAFMPLGPPVWLALEAAPTPDGTLRRLAVAQDTGGAIRGPVRGDLFWGAGPEAERRAGMMKATGTYYLLLPKAVAARRQRMSAAPSAVMVSESLTFAR
jgi:membrane-bound lytic murein transglycosylase A